MANYRLKKETEKLFRIALGRDTIGWCRLWDSGAWEAKAKGARGVGATAEGAFRELVRNLNNVDARRAGYDNAREMVEAHNAAVRAEVESVNKVLRDMGMPSLLKARRARRILV